jgi:hypothetical protein
MTIARFGKSTNTLTQTRINCKNTKKKKKQDTQVCQAHLDVLIFFCIEQCLLPQNNKGKTQEQLTYAMIRVSMSNSFNDLSNWPFFWDTSNIFTALRKKQKQNKTHSGRLEISIRE